MSVPLLKNNNPNVTWATTTIEITLQQWEYTRTFRTTFGGNCRGWSAIEYAISRIYEDLLGDNEFASVTLQKLDGDSLLVEDDEEWGEEWLHDMIVSSRILLREPKDRSSLVGSDQNKKAPTQE